MPCATDPAAAIPVEPSIGDHGLIGDMHTAALVDRWGRVNWMCWPQLDSQPAFSRLLDPEQGGYWQLAPDVPFVSTRRYLPDTNVLETTFSCAQGTVVATDFMAVPRDQQSGSQVIRMVEGRSGAVPFRMRLRANHGFENGAPILRTGEGAVRIGSWVRPVELAANEPINLTNDEATLDAVVETGQILVVVLGEHLPPAPLAGHTRGVRETTSRWWRQWVRQGELPAYKRDTAARSALALKLLHHEPSSTLIAAPTTSLPENPGGGRNWDYRYSWLRDSSMMILALQRLGHHDEAMRFWDTLIDMSERHGADLAVAYTLDGGLVPEERHIPGVSGYRKSRPVRVGNGAATQRQHDIYGHILRAAAHCFHHMDMDMAAPQTVLRNIADLAAQRWNRPDDSIWEVRGGRARHTYSHLMSWLALDKALDLAANDALTGDTANWRTQRDAARSAILDRAWNSDIGAFTGTLGGNRLDASVLVAPLIGFLPPDDPRCRATRQTVANRLSEGGLLRRYLTDDGIDEPEGPFLICTLWLADNYTIDNDPGRGEELLERVLSTGNDLGLMAEEANPATREPLGNFPQGLTHLGVIQSITRLDAEA